MLCNMFPVYLKRKDPILYPFLNGEGGLAWGLEFVLYLFVGILLETCFSGFIVSCIYELAYTYVYEWVSMSTHTYIHEEITELEHIK